MPSGAMGVSLGQLMGSILGRQLPRSAACALFTIVLAACGGGGGGGGGGFPLTAATQTAPADPAPSSIEPLPPSSAPVSPAPADPGQPLSPTTEDPPVLPPTPEPEPDSAQEPQFVASSEVAAKCSVP